jgi:hypothetical protein
MRVYYDYQDRKSDSNRCHCDEEREEKRCRCHEEKRCHCDEDRKCGHEEKCCDRHKFAHCCPKNPCPYPILFECTQGTGTEITQTIVSTNGTTNFFAPRSLGCLTIDTTCLKNPVVKFDFCSIIKYRASTDANTPVRLTFQLCKICDEGSEMCCGTWNYTAALDEENEQLTTSFCFSHCDCNTCPGCCTYIVKLIEAVNLISGDILIVTSPSLSAIAKSSC